MKKALEVVKGFNPIFWFLLGYIILCVILIPNFFNPHNVRNILAQISVLVTVACGVHFAVLNGGVDFSATSVIALAGVIGASIMSEAGGALAGTWYAVPVAIVVMLLIGLLFGLINGLSIIVFKMPSFIVTMAMQMIGVGLALLYTRGQTISALPASFTLLGTGRIGIIPFATIFALMVLFIAHNILSRTRLGREIYAIGTNPKTASISGIPVKKTIIKIFVISGLCAACAGIIMIAQMESAAPGFASGMFINIMASIIIGGTSPFGGRGKIMNTFMGVCLITLITVSMNMLGMRWFIINVIKGSIILIAASIDLVWQSKVKA